MLVWHRFMKGCKDSFDVKVVIKFYCDSGVWNSIIILAFLEQNCFTVERGLIRSNIIHISAKYTGDKLMTHLWDIMFDPKLSSSECQNYVKDSLGHP